MKRKILKSNNIVESTMVDIPAKLQTLNEEQLQRCLWNTIKEGQIVYLYAIHEGKQYGCGPFQVIDPEKRILRNQYSGTDFRHYPEELYRLVN